MSEAVPTASYEVTEKSETAIRKPLRDRLFLTILLTTVVLTGLQIGTAVFLRPVPVLAEAPWLVPVVDSFVVLVSVSVAFLAFGRYPVLRTPVSYWIGIGFMMFAILIIYRYIFYAPFLLAQSGDLDLSGANVFVWLSLLNVSAPVIFLLAAVLAKWPAGRVLPGRRLFASVAAWFVISSLVVLAMVAFPQALPVLFDPARRVIHPAVIVWEVLIIPVFLAGAALSTRRYLRTGDGLAGYVGLVQVVLAFAMIAILMTGPRYSVWWYWQRILAGAGYLALMFGLLAQYVDGFRRERESEARYRQLAESLPQLIWTCTPNGLCDYLSPQWVAYTGVPAEKHLSDGWIDVVHPDDRRLVLSEWNTSVESGVVFDTEYRLAGSTGGYRWFRSLAVPIRDEDGVITRWFGSNTDIDDKKRAEQGLLDSERRYRQLADAMPQLVWTAQPDGSIDYCNERSAEYDEIQTGNGAASPWDKMVHSDDLELTQSVWRRAVGTGEIYQVENRLRKAGGEYRWHLSRGVPAYDASGQVVKWFGTATDIHDLKEAEDSLQQYAAELERSNRDLQEFAFVASHDLQEPLRKVEAFGDAVMTHGENLTERQRDYLERMRRSANRMRNMVDGLLEFSRLTARAQPFERVDLNEVAAEVMTVLELQVEQSGAVVELDDLPTVEADRTQMRSLLQNLIGNALKFQPQGGQPVVRVRARQIAGEMVEIQVEDNGVGFDNAFLEQMFQPFKRLVARRDYDGSGIGLSICRNIVERHGGTITANGEKGIGAKFFVTLPAFQTKMEEDRSPIL